MISITRVSVILYRRYVVEMVEIHKNEYRRLQARLKEYMRTEKELQIVRYESHRCIAEAIAMQESK